MDVDLEFLKEVAREAGRYALSKQGTVKAQHKDFELGEVDEAYKRSKEAFSDVDVEAQAVIMEHLGKKYDQMAGIIAEESNDKISAIRDRYFTHHNELVEGKLTFVVDPIDGSGNYLTTDPGERHKLWGVSIAVLLGVQPVAGVIYYPAMGEGLTLSVQKGKGLFIDDKKIQLTDRDHDKKDLVRVSGASDTLAGLRKHFPPDSARLFSFTVTLLSLIVSHSRDKISALDEFTFVKYRAYISKHADLVDVGCGTLAIQESGGAVVDESCQDINPFESNYYDDNLHTMKEKKFFMLTPGPKYAKTLKQYLKDQHVNIEEYA